MHVFMMVGETGVPGVNPRRHGENMQTPHRKDLEIAHLSTEGLGRSGPAPQSQHAGIEPMTFLL